MAVMGVDAKVYYDAAGVGGGTYAAIDIVGEVTGDDVRTEGQIKLRGSDNVLYAVGQRDRAVTIQILYEPTDTGYIALETAFTSKTDIGLAFLDDEIGSGVKGWEGDYKISSWSKPQLVDDVWWVDVRAVPSADSGAQIPRDYVHSGV